MGHFTTKTDKIVFQFATSECHSHPKLTIVQIDLHSSTICLSRISGDISIDDIKSGTKIMTCTQQTYRHT